MIAHQTVCMHYTGKSFYDGTYDFKEIGMVVIIKEYRLSCIPPGGDMIHCYRKFYS